MNLDEVLARLQSLGDPANVEGMERFGIGSHDEFALEIHRGQFFTGSKAHGKSNDDLPWLPKLAFS
jgi:hypothetical protein